MGIEHVKLPGKRESLNYHRTYHYCIFENVHRGVIRVLGVWYKSLPLLIQKTSSLKISTSVSQTPHCVRGSSCVSSLNHSNISREWTCRAQHPRNVRNPLLHFKIKNNNKKKNKSSSSRLGLRRPCPNCPGIKVCICVLP